MSINIHIFASIREKVGKRILTINLEKSCTILYLLRSLAVDFPVFKEVERSLVQKNGPPYAVLIDGVQVSSAEAIVQEGSEIAILPPIGGG